MKYGFRDICSQRFLVVDLSYPSAVLGSETPIHKHKKIHQSTSNTQH